MKNLLPLSNIFNSIFFKKTNRILGFIVLVLFQTLVFNIEAQQTDLRDNPDYKAGECPANDIQILSARLVRGTQCNNCDAGNVLTADLIITIHHNTNSDNRFLAVMGDLKEVHPDGSTSTIDFLGCSGPVVKSSDEIAGSQDLNFGQISFTCASQLELSNILLVWTAANGECPLTPDNNPNGKYCYANPIISIIPPLNALVKASCAPLGKANFDLIVTGGSGDFSYLWSNGATTQDLSNVPLGTYSVIVTDNVNEDGNGNNCTVTGSATEDGPCCEFFATCKLNNAVQNINGCSINSMPVPLINISDVFTNVTSNPCGVLTLINNDDPSGTICPDGISVVRNAILHLSETTLGVKEPQIQDKTSRLVCYPTVVKEDLNLEYTATKNDVAKLMITNLEGKIVYKESLPIQQGTNSFTINLSSQAHGLYLLKLITSDSQEIQKIIKK